MLSLKDYYAQLKAHDWFYHMSDDGKAYKKGRAAQRTLMKQADEGEEYGDLFDGFFAHYMAKIRGVEPPALPKEPAK